MPPNSRPTDTVCFSEADGHRAALMPSTKSRIAYWDFLKIPNDQDHGIDAGSLLATFSKGRLPTITALSVKPRTPATRLSWYLLGFTITLGARPRCAWMKASWATKVCLLVKHRAEVSDRPIGVGPINPELRMDTITNRSERGDFSRAGFVRKEGVKPPSQPDASLRWSRNWLRFSPPNCLRKYVCPQGQDIRCSRSK